MSTRQAALTAAQESATERAATDADTISALRAQVEGLRGALERLIAAEDNFVRASGVTMVDGVSEAVDHARHILSTPCDGYVVVPVELTDAMKQAYGEAVYFTTDTRLLPENIWRALLKAASGGRR